MGQIEAYLVKDPNKSPLLQYLRDHPLSHAIPIVALYLAVPSQCGSTADEGNIDKFRSVLTSGEKSRSRAGEGGGRGEGQPRIICGGHLDPGRHLMRA